MMKLNLRWITLPVVISTLGYFVDIYDLILFSVVRSQSLTDLNIPADQVLDVGVSLLNWQMVGLLAGGFFWGILADKKGRTSVLFGSILIYSVANLLNAFVTNTTQYAFLRFLAGVGLGGELGAAITIVLETLPPHTRVYGTSFVGSVGLLGALLASTVANIATWRTLYVSGGVLGLILLVLRSKILEPEIFTRIEKTAIPRGDLKLLFSSFRRIKLFLCSVFIAIPIYFVVGVVITFAPEFALAQKALQKINVGDAIFYYYLGLAIGGLVAGYLSELFRSRKKVILLYMFWSLISLGSVLVIEKYTTEEYDLIAFGLGVVNGYWALFATVAAEQFGTNLRATVATCAPNLVRGSLVLLTLSFTSLKTHYGIVDSALMIGAVIFLLAFISLASLKETFGTNLDYLES